MRAGRGLRARPQDESLVGGLRIDADAPQRVEVGLDRVPSRGFGLAIEMRELPSPQARARRAFAGNGPARAQEARQVQSSRMLGEMDQQIEAPRAQAPQQPPFLADLDHDALPLPVAVDRVHLRDGRMAG